MDRVHHVIGWHSVTLSPPDIILNVSCLYNIAAEILCFNATTWKALEAMFYVIGPICGAVTLPHKYATNVISMLNQLVHLHSAALFRNYFFIQNYSTKWRWSVDRAGDSSVWSDSTITWCLFSLSPQWKLCWCLFFGSQWGQNSFSSRFLIVVNFYTVGETWWRKSSTTHDDKDSHTMLKCFKMLKNSHQTF